MIDPAGNKRADNTKDDQNQNIQEGLDVKKNPKWKKVVTVITFGYQKRTYTPSSGISFSFGSQVRGNLSEITQISTLKLIRYLNRHAEKGADDDRDDQTVCWFEPNIRSFKWIYSFKKLLWKKCSRHESVFTSCNS